MKRRIAIFLSCFIVWAGAFAATEPNREAALKALENSVLETRVAAADSLGEVGTMDDVVALLNSLRDEDETYAIPRSNRSGKSGRVPVIPLSIDSTPAAFAR